MSCPAATATPASLDAGMSAQTQAFFIDVAQRATAPQLDGFVQLFSPCPAGQSGMPPNCFTLTPLPGSVGVTSTPGPSYPLAAALASSQSACLGAAGPTTSACPATFTDPTTLDNGLSTDAKIALIATVQQSTAAQLDTMAQSLSQFPLAAKFASDQAACLRNPSLAISGGTGWWASQTTMAKAEIVGGVAVVFGLVAYTIYKKKKKK